MQTIKSSEDNFDLTEETKPFNLPDLDDPIVPLTSENNGIQGIVVAIAVVVYTTA